MRVLGGTVRRGMGPRAREYVLILVSLKIRIKNGYNHNEHRMMNSAWIVFLFTPARSEAFPAFLAGAVTTEVFGPQRL